MNTIDVSATIEPVSLTGGVPTTVVDDELKKDKFIDTFKKRQLEISEKYKNHDLLARTIFKEAHPSLPPHRGVPSRGFFDE